MLIERRDLFICGGLLLLVGLFTGLVWWPAHSGIRQLRTDISEAEEKLGIARDRSDGLALLAGEVERLRERKNSTNKVIPMADEKAEVLRTLSVYVEDQNLTDRNMSTDPEQATENYLVMPVHIEFTGDSLAAFEFVHRLESMTKMVQVEELDMRMPDPTVPDVRTSLKLNTYFAALEDRTP